MIEKSEFRYRGAITRIRLCNFMTYTDTELYPGPNLNMILGPNGTGKSAVVCCIIVGLAGEVTLTGRGGSPADFVKKDTEWGSTEIELYNEGSTGNYIVHRKIIITNRSQFKLDHKSEWKINGQPCKKSQVQALTKELNIKVDNLCQFLPQDSVTQFVKMNSCELLLNTLKAAGDNQLVSDHQRLVEYTKEYEEKRSILESLEKACKENEVNAKRLESEVNQLREREALVKDKVICGQKMHYVRYLDSQKNVESARSEFMKLKEDLKKIENISEPYRRAVEHHKDEASRLRQVLESSSNEVKLVMDSIQKTQNSIADRNIDCQKEFAKYKGKCDQENSRESTLRLKHQELESLECRLSEVRDIDCSKEIQKCESEIAQKKQELLENNRMRAKLDDALRSYVSEMDETRRERDQIMSVREKKVTLLKTKFPEAHRALEWMSKNPGLFKKKVFSPLMCEINVKDPKFNNIIEHAISRPELSSFVCQSSEDLTTLTRRVRDELNIRVNVILAPDKTLEDFENESSQMPDLSQLGIKSYLRDLIDAPEPIMRYLCGNNNFHRIPVAENCSEVQLKELLSKRIPKFYAGNQFYTISRSRYDQQFMTVSDSVRDAQYLHYSLDTKRLSDCNTRYQRLQESSENARKERDTLLKDHDNLQAHWQSLLLTHRDLKNKHDERKKLETLIELNKKSTESLMNEKIDLAMERLKLQKSIEKINKQLTQILEKLLKGYQSLVKLKEIHMTNLLLYELANRNQKVAVRKYTNAQRDTTRLKEDIRKKENNLATFMSATKELAKVAEEKIPGFKEGTLDRSTQRKFNSVPETTLEDLSNKKEELMVRIQRIYKDSNGAIEAEFAQQNQELKDKRVNIAKLETSISKITNERTSIKKKWLPRLEEVIETIDKNYREFMRGLSYDGQVKLDFDPAEPDDFSSYGITILVKYRDNEQLIPLSSTRQSGGERSVATMIYMLALQTKTTAPFRCVDEINQGMDKENERKVFELLVRTADSSSSQYFLVSPKLLSNLPYSPKMKIHVVFNGSKLGVAWNSIPDLLVH